MILFCADNHYGSHNGQNLAKRLDVEEELLFFEDDLSAVPRSLARDDCNLFVLSWISDTPGAPHPGTDVEQALLSYLKKGRPLLLFHGGSAAFAQWPWWRELVGLRWVRAKDPDGFEASTHPIQDYRIVPAKTRHPLVQELQPFSVPDDEIYINLEQTAPVTVLMTTTIDHGTFPQAYISHTPWGGTVGGFIPGHRPHAFESRELLSNVESIARYLLQSSSTHIANNDPNESIESET